MKTPVEQAPAPLVSDGRMRAHNGDQLMDPEDVRDEYETALTKMRAERDDLVGELRSQIQVYKDRMGEPTHEANCVCGYHRIEALLSKYKTE